MRKDPTFTQSGISWRSRTGLALLAPLALLVLGSGLTARAGTITYTCDASITAGTPAGTCSTLNGTIAGLYSSTFTNANASIFIQLGKTGLGSSNQFEAGFTYDAYRAALAATASGDATDTAFLADDAPAAEPAFFSGAGVQLTTADANAVGLADTVGITAGGSECFSVGSAGCYNGIITISNTASLFFRSGSPTGEYDFFTVAEHETDEILGTSSCLNGSSGVPADGCIRGTFIAPADLGRFTSAGRSFLNTANGQDAYFSVDGGLSIVEHYNNVPNGADYGDWKTTCTHVQDAFGCLGKGGLDITNDGGVEIKVLDAVGYNLTTTGAAAEPGSLLLLALVILAFAGLAVRERFSSRRLASA